MVIPLIPLAFMATFPCLVGCLEGWLWLVTRSRRKQFEVYVVLSRRFRVPRTQHAAESFLTTDLKALRKSTREWESEGI